MLAALNALMGVLVSTASSPYNCVIGAECRWWFL
jgi:hypothetical protein